MSTWRTLNNYGGHPGAPAQRTLLKPVTTGVLTVRRIRSIRTDDLGTTTDSGWSGWSTWVDATGGVDWLLPGYASRAGSSWTKTECFIEVAAGIGRPWKVIFRRKITNTATGVITYSSDEEQLFTPGVSASVLFDATNGTTQELGSAAALIPADGL